MVYASPSSKRRAMKSYEKVGPRLKNVGNYRCFAAQKRLEKSKANTALRSFSRKADREDLYASISCRYKAYINLPLHILSHVTPLFSKKTTKNTSWGKDDKAAVTPCWQREQTATHVLRNVPSKNTKRCYLFRKYSREDLHAWDCWSVLGNA
jgi:hypothetical protein